MGLFGDLDVASAVDPLYVPPGTHECYLTKADVKQMNGTDKDGEPKFPSLILTFTIADDEGDLNGLTVSEFKSVPPSDKADTPKGKAALGWLKNRLDSLGVPADRMNDLDPNDLVGIHCYVTVKKNGDYTNVQKVVVIDDAALSVSPTDNPFTPAKVSAKK